MRAYQALGFSIFVSLIIVSTSAPNPKTTGKNFRITSGSKNSPPARRHGHRLAREIRMLKLKDPLDCLSQIVCGLNTNPPQRPSVRTNTANDFAFLLKSAITKLRSQKPPTTTTTTTTTPAPKTTTAKIVLNDDEDEDDEYDEDSIENDMEYEDRYEPEDYYNGGPPDPPPVPIDRRISKKSSIFSSRRGESSKKRNKKLKGKPKHVRPKPTPGTTQKPLLTPLDRLRMETDLRAKLLSDAQCVNGLIDHTCPFNYQQMLSLISSSLEREKTVSYSANKVLPMVGYLIKSRNYTGTLAATFTALERINNYTIEADREGKPIDFSHILDEVMNRVTGDNGLRIVDTSNDSASASVWEDDEFDHVLQNPYISRRPESSSYNLGRKKQKQKERQQQKKKQVKPVENDDQSLTSEEDTSEEGLVFDQPRPPASKVPDNDSSSEEDQKDNHSQVFESAEKNKKKYGLSNKEKLAPPPVFGHIRKNAEDE